MDATGERYIPEAMSGELIEAEHQARYRLAMTVAEGRDVLDAACGVGWGSELLLSAGASSVTGVDISEDAIEDAKSRAPEVTFVLGDILKLPFDDASFDLVACFETIEHVPQPAAVIAEFVRVLRPGGIVMISSPNPEVYPAGNPFHEKELTAAELLELATRSFTHAELWGQYGLLASVLIPGIGRDRYEVGRMWTMNVAPIEAGREPYSLVVASDSSLPSLEGQVMLSPTDQIDAVNEEARRIQEDRAAMSADHERVVAEREQILAERADLHAQLAKAGEALEAQQRRIDEISEGDASRLERDRDRLGMLLVDAEQRVAGIIAENESLRESLDLALAQSPVSMDVEHHRSGFRRFFKGR